MIEDLRTEISDLTPAGKLVFKILEYGGPMTQKELVEQSRLSARTVRNVLNDLEDIGAVSEEVYLQDARQNLYRLTDAVLEPARVEGATREEMDSSVGLGTDD